MKGILLEYAGKDTDAVFAAESTLSISLTDKSCAFVAGVSVIPLSPEEQPLVCH